MKYNCLIQKKKAPVEYWNTTDCTNSSGVRCQTYCSVFCETLWVNTWEMSSPTHKHLHFWSSRHGKIGKGAQEFCAIFLLSWMFVVFEQLVLGLFLRANMCLQVFSPLDTLFNTCIVAAKMGVLGRILSFTTYMRSALGQWPLYDVHRCQSNILAEIDHPGRKSHIYCLCSMITRVSNKFLNIWSYFLSLPIGICW